MTRVSALAALILTGALFGFFYAWVCSTMWGLDATDPRTAIAAMQAMNASVRNAVFAPAFFATPFLLVLTAALAWRENRQAASLFAAAGLVTLTGSLILTATVNVPMNNALALETVPQDIDSARALWSAYSEKWQVFNQIRTAATGVALLLTGLGLLALGRR